MPASARTKQLRLAAYVVLVVVCFRGVVGDCWYNDHRHEEGFEVLTGEPCLNCTCSRSILLCYLRVCPKLPNPPPPGCILLHRYRACCPELICSDFSDGTNSLEARSDPGGDLDIEIDDKFSYENACISNGSIYGPGSAMHSSSLCEYCYCLAGKQICVKPKCLLPVEGCFPVFEDTSCCPIRYNCTSPLLGESGSSTTQSSSSTSASIGGNTIFQGCLVDEVYYHEGGKVLGMGHSVCDNCYCLRGVLRCEPLSCAPPLLGCTPVIKPGECCAASYNCNGTIEIEPEPNYGMFPTVSKEYAKLRKEVQRKPSNPKNKDGVVTIAPFYVIAESLQSPTTNKVHQRSSDTYGTTRHFSGVYFYPSSTTKSPKQQISTFQKDSDKEKVVPGAYFATTNYEFQNTNYKRVYSTTFRSKEGSTLKNIPATRSTTTVVAPLETKEDKIEDQSFLGFENLNILSIVDSLLDDKLDRKVDNDSYIPPQITNTSTKSSTEPDDIETYYTEHNTEITSTNADHFKNLDAAVASTVKYSDDPECRLGCRTTLQPNTESTTSTDDYLESTAVFPENISSPITVRIVVKSIDCIDNKKQNLDDQTKVAASTVLPVDPGEVNKLAESRSDILSTTEVGDEDLSSEDASTEDNDVDFRTKGGLERAPTHIEAGKNDEEFDYDYNEPTLPPSLPNLKIIPFLAADALDAKKNAPKDPTPIFIEKKIDENFNYNTNLFSPPVETEGGFLPKEPPILDTFYDNVVSVPSLTNLPKNNDKTLNPIPPPLDYNILQEMVTVAEGILPPDPFRDVIRTEPAPNLQSLWDMMLQRINGTTQEPPESPDLVTRDKHIVNHVGSSTTEFDDSFALDKVLQFIFSGGKNGENDKVGPDNSTSTNMSTTNTTTPSNTLEHSNMSVLNTTNILSTTTITPEKTTNLAPLTTNFSGSSKTTTNSIFVKTTNKTASVFTRTTTLGPGVGLLKLAGCNIYGRMYRVGRIISELSGPCLECKCTDVGVQCRQLRC